MNRLTIGIVTSLLRPSSAAAIQLSPEGTPFEKRLAQKGQPTGERLLGKLTSSQPRAGQAATV